MRRLVHGGDEPLPERLAVRAGPLSLVIEAGDVRHVHVGGREVVRRIYGAVRDHAWRTIPARLSGFTLERGADTFRCRYHAEHRQEAVAFDWDATIEGAADGTLTFAFDGVAEATFERNRIGLCLLHPLPALSGARVRVTTTGGAHRLLAFPDLVTVEQPIAGFDDIATLACEIGADLWLEATVEGDVFQAEDQRNWIDASTKIYSTPVTLPKPVTVPRGTRIAQRVTLRLRTARGDAARLPPTLFVVDRADGALRVGDGRTGRLPAIGVRAAGAVRARAARPSARRSGSRRRRRPGDARGASARRQVTPARRSSSRCTCRPMPARRRGRSSASTSTASTWRACSPSPSATTPPSPPRSTPCAPGGRGTRATRPSRSPTARPAIWRASTSRRRRSWPRTRCAGRCTRRRTPPT